VRGSDVIWLIEKVLLPEAQGRNPGKVLSMIFGARSKGWFTY